MLTPNGGVFGRNPKFNNVTVENNLTVNGDFTLGDDIVINDTLLVNGVATFRGGIISIPNSAAPTSNTVLGSVAGASMQSGATYNTCIGSNAGNALTTADFNVFVGAQTGVAVTTGSQNVAVGYAAYQVGNGTSNTAVGMLSQLTATSGGANTSVGAGSLQSNLVGNNNVAVGANALNLNTASDITAVGANALDANTTGTGNTAVGKDALGACTTGANNTAVGFGAADAITTGAANVAVGTSALGNSTVGSNTVAVGLGALSSFNGNDSVAVGGYCGGDALGGQNTLVGYAVMYSTTSGGENTALGNLAGRYIADNATVNASCSNSVFVGSQARPNASGQTNQIVIGQGAIGNGSNTTTIGNSSTTNTFIAGGDLRVAGGIRAVNDPTLNPPSGHSAAFYVPTHIGTLTDAVVVGNPNQAATLRMTHNGAGAIQCSFGRLTASGTFDEHLRVSGTTAAGATTSVLGTAASTSTSTGALVVSGGVGVAGAIYPGDNIVMASGKGIDFSAHSNAAGMTSELLSDYEEGTWTPVYAPTTGTFATMTMDVTGSSATYTKIGRFVFVNVNMKTDNVDITGGSGALSITGLPFTPKSGEAAKAGMMVAYAAGFVTNPIGGFFDQSNKLIFQTRGTLTGATSNLGVAALTTGANADSNDLWWSGCYIT